MVFYEEIRENGECVLCTFTSLRDVCGVHISISLLFLGNILRPKGESCRFYALSFQYHVSGFLPEGDFLRECGNWQEHYLQNEPGVSARHNRPRIDGVGFVVYNIHDVSSCCTLILYSLNRNNSLLPQKGVFTSGKVSSIQWAFSTKNLLLVSTWEPWYLSKILSTPPSKPISITCKQLARLAHIGEVFLKFKLTNVKDDSRSSLGALRLLCYGMNWNIKDEDWMI